MPITVFQWCGINLLLSLTRCAKVLCMCKLVVWAAEQCGFVGCKDILQRPIFRQVETLDASAWQTGFVAVSCLPDRNVSGLLFVGWRWQA